MIVKSISQIFKAEWLICLLLAVLAFFGASLFMTGWPMGLAPELVTPYSYSGDGMAYLWNIQRVLEGAWYFENHRTGFPFGSNHLDYPTADTGSYVALKLLGWLLPSASATLNLYYLLGFSLAAIAGYLVARTVGVSKSFAVATALLYAFTSFHFGRLGHLFFTWYFVAPLFFYVGFRLLSDKQIFLEKSQSLSSKLMHALALCALACFGIYYSFFGCLVILFCTAIALCIHRSWKYALEGLLTLFFIIFGVLLNVLPSLLNILHKGENREGVSRLAAESELYALKIVQLLLPRGDHRLDTFFEFTNRYNSAFPLITENVSASLGMVGSIGFFVLLVAAFSLPFLWHNNTSNRYRPTYQAATPAFQVWQLQILAILCIGLVLMGTVGGFSSLFSMLVSSAIRSWNRISIYIAFVCVLACVLVINLLVTKFTKPSAVRFVGIFLAAALLVFGVLDQTVKPCHSCLLANQSLFKNDRDFIHVVESSLPISAAIYQLPYATYPENGAIHAMGSYDQARGHLHSKHLNWSFGGMRGREGDWFYRKLAQLPISEQVTIISAMGMSGIYIDRRGYLDIKPESVKRCADFLITEVSKLKNNCMAYAELEQVIANTPETISDSKPLTSSDNQLVFFPLKSNLVTASSIAKANLYLQPIGYVLVNGIPQQLEGGFDTAIDLRKDDPDMPYYYGGVTGVAGISISNGERLGRWSDALKAKHVTVWLAKPLPKKFQLQVTAQAAGLNTVKPMQIKIGDQTKELLFGSEFETKSVSFEINKPIYKIEFIPADPFSPARRWGSGVNDLIAIHFQKIRIQSP
jgi:phosphoglycerol transferase